MCSCLATSSCAKPRTGGSRWQLSIRSLHWNEQETRRLPRPPSKFVNDSWGHPTGDQLIVWGGIGAGGSIPSHGETYDPVKNVWSALPKAPLRARVDAVAVWSGAQMLIWGGSDARGVTKPIATFSALSDGAALTPASA